MSFLTRKYPFELKKNGIKDGLIYSAIVVIILYFLQPFGLHNYEGNKLLLSLLFGAITFVCYMAFSYAIFIPSTKKVKTWRIWHHVLAVLAMVLFIGIGNFICFCLVFRLPMSPDILFKFIYWTLIIGVIISTLATALNYQRFLRSRLDMMLEKNSDEQKGVIVSIHDGRVRGNDLKIQINDLLYIEAQKNYVSVCHIEAGELKRDEIQATLATVLEGLADYPNIFQCHRSFAVNVNSITGAKGNSNGYMLTLGDNLATVPVSRAFVPKLKSFIS